MATDLNQFDIKRDVFSIGCPLEAGIELAIARKTFGLGQGDVEIIPFPRIACKPSSVHCGSASAKTYILMVLSFSITVIGYSICQKKFWAYVTGSIFEFVIVGQLIGNENMDLSLLAMILSIWFLVRSLTFFIFY